MLIRENTSQVHKAVRRGALDMWFGLRILEQFLIFWTTALVEGIQVNNSLWLVDPIQIIQEWPEPILDHRRLCPEPWSRESTKIGAPQRIRIYSAPLLHPSSYTTKIAIHVIKRASKLLVKAVAKIEVHTRRANATEKGARSTVFSPKI